MTSTNPHWAVVVDYSPFPLIERGLFPSCGKIIPRQIIMMMALGTNLLLLVQTSEGKPIITDYLTSPVIRPKFIKLLVLMMTSYFQGCETCGSKDCERHDSSMSAEPWVGLQIHKQLDQAIEDVSMTFCNFLMILIFYDRVRVLSDVWMRTRLEEYVRIVAGGVL